ncbi:MAG: DUF2911 domain-containing protein, partial [Thermoanaerobaculia bacterium]|nr:DUF2911 domain-containing protein [Thermoanaerobaculia bacterium]
AALPAAAQSVTLPPSGDNQKASVTQSIGLVKVTVDYSSPDVHAPDGADRRGKIWGGLVPYGWTAEGFGTCGQKCPWRGGANENTVFTTSHAIQVEGQPLAAGRYGLQFVPGESEWIVIFSKNSTSWGHYTYAESEDALRVTVKPEKAPYREWLTYEFTDRRSDQATLALAWEELAVPIRIAVPDAVELYAENLRRELRSAPGFTADGWQQAAQYLIGQKAHLDWAEAWAQNAVSLPFIGRESFATLKTLADAQTATGKAAEAKVTMAKALAHPTATPIDYYQYARPMIREGKAAEALALFQQAAKRFPGAWPTDVGIARSYSALGKYKDALKHAKAALAIAPDDVNKKNLERMIGLLEQGQDMNQ